MVRSADVTQVTLPSADWEWVSDWRVDVSACTDEHGWQYATTRDQFDDAENPPHRCVLAGGA